MWRVLLLSVVAVAVMIGETQPAFAEKRVALVVGINKYDNFPDDKQLQRARSDAETVAESLRKIGFKVILGADISRFEFNQKLSEFQKSLEPGDVAAVFYAGHGIEIDRQNYLLPRDTPPVRTGDDELLIREVVSLDSILEMLEKKGTRISLIILDACRDNPFADSAGRSVGATRGLSRIEPPTGTFVMYSAGAHQSALDRLGDDDDSKNSVYTRILVPLLGQPDRSIQAIAKEVQVKVKALAETVKHVQHPAYYDEIIGDFYLVSSSATAATPTPQEEEEIAKPAPVAPSPDKPAEPQPSSAKFRGEMAYLNCVESNDLTCYKAFIADFPDHPRARQVEKIMRTQIEIPRYEACESANSYSDTLKQCHLYLVSFPNGRYRERAEAIINRALEENEQKFSASGQDQTGTGPLQTLDQPTQQMPLPAQPSREFTIHNGYDLYGGDYSRLAGKVDYSTCVAACRNDSRCKAFTYNTQARACFLKSQVPSLSPFNNAISGVLASLNQPSGPRSGTCGAGFTTYDNTDFFGNDLGGYNAGLQRCRELCLTNGRCRGFSWINKQVSKRCWLKFALAPPSTSSGIVSCARN